VDPVDAVSMASTVVWVMVDMGTLSPGMGCCCGRGVATGARSGLMNEAGWVLWTRAGIKPRVVSASDGFGLLTGGSAIRACLVSVAMRTVPRLALGSLCSGCLARVRPVKAVKQSRQWSMCLSSCSKAACSRVGGAGAQTCPVERRAVSLSFLWAACPMPPGLLLCWHVHTLPQRHP
jgi:hypothetical protein